MENTWPGGEKHAMTQTEHRHWSADNYPGTRQLCDKCEKPTGRCEDDTISGESGEAYCEQCADAMWYCDDCGVFVEPDNVTFEESHDTRLGGCGNVVEEPGT